mmetsp:Transcript_23038/g.38131  ORF Transcript_23038/g.38131 Transcript_23038/m.38131 type:complete len:154 (-) Transcript_23038:58-519(-)
MRLELATADAPVVATPWHELSKALLAFGSAAWQLFNGPKPPSSVKSVLGARTWAGGSVIGAGKWEFGVEFGAVGGDGLFPLLNSIFGAGSDSGPGAWRRPAYGVCDAPCLLLLLLHAGLKPLLPALNAGSQPSKSAVIAVIATLACFSCLGSS